MTREEAARVLKYLWIERDKNAKLMQQLTKSFFERQEALRIGAAALRGPQPDPDTGLVPCGCGGKAIPVRLPHPIKTLTCVACETCFVTTPYLEDDEAKDVWNRAMGWREGNEN